MPDSNISSQSTSDGHEAPVGQIPVSTLHRRLGAIPLPSGGTRFTVFAPGVQRLSVRLADSDREFEMQRDSDGYYTTEVAESGTGTRYWYRTDTGNNLPDPASRFQPDGVHGPSQVIDSTYEWQAKNWAGIEREDLVIYETHIGTLTDAGTFRSAIARLDELVDLGVTAIELMPVAACAGDRNWGYDGVHFYAPMSAYGTPDDFRAFVDAAHQRGIAVILDVVYNHLGPEGNYLGQFGGYLADQHETRWGDSLNFDTPPNADQIRRFIIANAIYWLDEYQLDGLRVDALHCTHDDSDRHLMFELGAEVQDWAKRANRRIHLIAESNIYDPEVVVPTTQGGMAFDAQWADDFLHSMFAVYQPDVRLCVRSYHKGHDLDEVLRRGYVFHGTLNRPQQRATNEPQVDRRGLVFSIQNHDFIGNHPLGLRFHQVTSIAAQKAAATLLLLSPSIPMLFMGEEFACEQPFNFFVDFSDEDLRQNVINGRRAEYPQHDWSGGVLPTDKSAFNRSKIGPSAGGNASMLKWYKQLINIRKAWRSAGLLSDLVMIVDSRPAEGFFKLTYRTKDAQACVIVGLLGGVPPEGLSVDDRFNKLGESGSVGEGPWAAVYAT